MAFEQGDVVAGYVIERLLGAGGMGEVYVARHPRLPRSDALKVLAPQFAADPQFRARFEREADLAARLSHHSIVSVHDRGEFDGHLWMALELIDGRDVGALLRGSPRGIAGVEAVRIVSAVADALDYAGARGLIHRDVKPANILLSSAGGVLLTDFGIARMGPENSELTATGTTVGTLNYSSPEQLRGDVLDPRSDQYALAATTFHLLTGGVPFADTNAGAVIIAHATRPVPSVRTARPDLPPAVDQVVARGMAKDPQQRYPTAKAFAEALAAVVPQGAVGAPVVDTVGVDPARTVVPGEIPPDAPTVVPGPRPHAEQRSRKRGPVLAGIAVVLMIAVVVVVGVVVIVRGAAEDGGDQVAVSPEARSLTPALATPLLKSLSAQPGRSRWVYAAPAGVNTGTPKVVGGDVRRVLVKWDRYAPAPSSHTNPAVDIVDAESGQSTGIVDLSPSLAGITQCAMVADTAACVAYEAGGDNKHLIMIDVAAKRVTADHVFRKFGDVFASGNLFTANAYIPPDGPTVTSRSYRLDGTEAWRVGPRLPGEKERTEDQFVPDVGIAVTSFTAEAVDPLSAETDGTRVFRISDGKKLYEGARSSVLAYRGGFAVTPKGTVGSVQFYDLDGNALATADGGWTVADAPRTVGGVGHQQASPPLPVLVRNDQGRTVIGVFNPATGTELWRRAVDAPIGSMQVQGVGSKIVIRGNRGTFAYDAYTADETSVGSNRDDPILGTDGSRVAAWKQGSGVAGMVVVSDRPGEPGWSMPLDAQPAVIGGGLYTSGFKPARVL